METRKKYYTNRLAPSMYSSNIRQNVKYALHNATI